MRLLEADELVYSRAARLLLMARNATQKTAIKDNGSPIMWWYALQVINYRQW